MDKEVSRKRALQRLKNFIIAAILCFVGINVALNYLMMGMVYIGRNTQVNSTPNTTIENQSLEDVDISFRIRYLYNAPEGFDLKLVVIISLGVAFFICIKLDQMWMIKYGNKNTKGDGRFATEKDLKNNKDFYCSNEKHLEDAEKSGIILAKYGNKLYCDTSTSNSMIIGTTRSGKGQTFVLPKIRAIAMSKDKHSLVVNDPKGEICENLYDILVSNGYEVVILNLADTNKSSLWNPLEVIKESYIRAKEQEGGDLSETTDMINSLAHVLTDNPKSDPIWPDSARSLLVAMILYLLEDAYKRDSKRTDGIRSSMSKVSMYSVYQFFIAFGTINRAKVISGVKRNVNALDELFQALPIDDPARAAYATSNFSAGEMRASIFATLSSNIQIFGSDTGVAKLTSGNQIKYSNLIQAGKPCAVFMVVPDEKPSRHVISSLFINQCYEMLVAESRAYPNNKLPQRVIFELDEFGNMVRIPNMDNKITVAAGRNILWSLYCQDLNQLDTKYDTAAKTIRSNCANVIYIQSIDKDTNDYFSALLGNETLEFRTYSGNLREWLDHQNVNIDSRPLLSGEQLSRLDEGTAITKRMRCYPIKTKLDYFYKLGIVPTQMKDIPINIITVDLKKSIYNFAPIAQTIQLLLKNGIMEDITPVPQAVDGFAAGVNNAGQHTQQSHNEAASARSAKQVPLFKPVPVTPSIEKSGVCDDNSYKFNPELEKAIEKLDIYVDGQVSKLIANGNLSDVSKIVITQYKVKRHINANEFKLLTEFINANQKNE